MTELRKRGAVPKVSKPLQAKKVVKELNAKTESKAKSSMGNVFKVLLTTLSPKHL